jgi:4-hydroxythreonine-4-phosphate dehydrogenase
MDIPPTADTPLVALTMGDAAGIGPETIVRAWAEGPLGERRVVVLGHPEILRRAARSFAPSANIVVVSSLGEAREALAAGDLPCLPCGGDDVLDVPIGTVDARSGAAAGAAIVRAAELALAGEIDAITTAPISKAALHLAGFAYPGHTELLAEHCGARDFAMMLYLPAAPALRGPAGLGVVHVTLHTSIDSVPEQITRQSVLAKIRLADDAMRRLGVVAPRIGVCALNPHAGEQGLFGDEEERFIAPAVAAAQSEGLQATGPLPADTLLVAARDGQYDAVVAMYHDQGHIALKLLGMHRAVNVTLGLPIVRTSAAHGTAFDIAGRGVADWRGLASAVEVAIRLALRRKAMRTV